MDSKRASYRFRVGLVAFLLLAAFVLLIGQLVRWQVVERSRLLPEGQSAVPRVHQKGPKRGTITDINGQPFAYDIYRWEVWVEPWRVPKDQVERLASELQEVLGSYLQLAPEEVVEALSSDSQVPVTLTRHAPQAVGEIVGAKADWPGIELVAVPTRYYPQHSLASQVVGFVNDEPSAYYGVEQYYDEYLRETGEPVLRSRQAIRQRYGQLPEGWQVTLPSSTGQDLVLTLDQRIQYVAEQVLADALGRYGAEAGTIIVMDPFNGDLLAMASLPTYDPNRYGLAGDTVRSNPAVNQQYEPGSVFKIVTVAAAIDAGLIDASTVFTDTVSFDYGGRTIYNWDRLGRGEVTTREALIASRNIPIAQIALKLEESLFYQYVSRFGFGKPTEVDLAGEHPGTVKAPGNPLWSESDLAANSFGQGLAATPLQMVTAAAVIANGGVYVRPHVLHAKVYQGQVVTPDTSPVRQVIRPETAALMTDLMVDVVEEGAKAAQVQGYAIAGKTGTAQVAVEGGYHPTETIATFVGFVPAYNPKFVALVKLDKPKANSWAVNTAAPAFAKLAQQLLFLLNVSPEQVAIGP